MTLRLPVVGVESPFAAIPGLRRLSRGLAALCLVASSAGCLLTKDLPDPALDIPPAYKAGRLTESGCAADAGLVARLLTRAN